MKHNLDESTLRDYLTIIFRHKVVIITTFLAIMICTVIGLELKTPVYQAQVKMLVSAEKQTSSPYYREMGGSRQGDLTQSEIVNSNPVLGRAVRVLKLDERPNDYEKYFCTPIKTCLLNLTAWAQDLKSKLSKSDEIPPEKMQLYMLRCATEALKGNISVASIRDTDLFTITVADFDPEMAATIANVVSRSYVIFDLEQQLVELQVKHGEKNQLVVQLKDNIDEMTKNLNGTMLSNTEAIGPASVKIIEQAQIPFEPTGTSKYVNIALAFSMSIFLGIMLAFGLEYVNQTFKSAQDIEEYLNLPVLGSITKNGHNGKSSRHIDTGLCAYQPLADQMYMMVNDNKLKSILITALSPLEGSSRVIAYLSKYLSQEAHHKIFIVETNLKQPSLHTFFDTGGKPGLAEVLEGKSTLEDATVKINECLSVLPAGKTTLNPTTLLNSSRMREVINTVREKTDMLFVDYAYLGSIKDVRILSSLVDGIAIVVTEGKTRRPVIKAAITLLEQSKANVIGTILNNRTFVIPKIIYNRL
ncbi:MAG: exoP 1 [Candidatus Brocadiaceae bacterium]|nr:exoP 1 [Candidatus Brocadiaceae bacterium]